MDNDIRLIRKELDNLSTSYKDLDFTTEYCQTTDGENPPVNGKWSTTRPASVDGYYIWARNCIDTGYGFLYTDPILLADDLSIVESFDVEYCVSTSWTTPPSANSTWVTDAPYCPSGSYIWSRTKIVTNSGTTYTSPVRLTGEKGESGASIKGDSSVLHIRYSSVSNPLTTSQVSRSPTNGVHYLGTYIDTIEEDNDNMSSYDDPSLYSWALFNPRKGIEFEDGKSVHIKYATSIIYNSKGEVTSVTLTDNDGEDAGKYMGVCIDRNEDDPTNPLLYTWKEIEGLGIASIVEYYGESTSYNTDSKPATWSTTVPTYKKGYYYWTKSIITYTDGSTEETKPVCVSGSDGDGVQFIYTTTNNIVTWTTVPTGVDNDKWFDDPQEINSTKKYMWQSMRTSTNGVWSKFSQPVVWAVYSVDGTQRYVHIRYSINSDGTDFTATYQEGMMYMGVYEGTSSTAPTNKTSYTWTQIKGIDGESVDVNTIINTVQENIDLDNIDAVSLNGATDYVKSTITQNTMSNSNGGTLYYYKIGELCIVELSQWVITATATSGYMNNLLPSSLPSAYQPNHMIAIAGVCNSNDKAVLLRLHTGGNMSVKNTVFTSVRDKLTISGTFVYAVDSRMKTSLSIASTSVLVGNSLVYTLKDNKGAVMQGELVTITFNGVKYNRTTNSNGQVSLGIHVPRGNYTNTTAVYNTNSEYVGATNSNTITVTKPTPVITITTPNTGSRTGAFTGRVTNGTNPLRNITVKVSAPNGSTNTGVTDSNGYFSVKLANLVSGMRYGSVKYFIASNNMVNQATATKDYTTT